MPPGLPTPYYAVWEITLACNLKCIHCGSRAGKARDRELTTEECFRIVDQLADLGVHDVTLIGGEAYLRDDWDLVLKRIADRGMFPSVSTGGRGLTPERARRAKEAGVTTFGVSIDGLEQSHDTLRGVKGSWRWAMDALDMLRDAGLYITSNCQVNRLNKHELEPLFDLLIAKGVRGWQVQMTAALGRAADHPEILLQPYDLLDVIPRIAALKQKGDEHGIMVAPGNNVGYFGPYETILRSHGDRKAHWEGCGAGVTTIGIESDGTFKGCPSLQTEPYAAGNLTEQSAQEIWANSAVLRNHREFSKKDLWGFCGECYYAETCRAGCSFTAHGLLGKPGNYPYCYHRAETLKARGQREVLVPAERAPGKPFDNGRFELKLIPFEEPHESDPRPVPAVPPARFAV